MVAYPYPGIFCTTWITIVLGTKLSDGAIYLYDVVENIFPYKEQGDLVLTQKPNGILSHADGTGSLGFVEKLSAQIGHKLLVCHRLDRETSGAMIFAKTKIAAARLTKLFEYHEVQKTYVFCTSGDRDRKDFEIRSEIKKIRGRLVSHLTGNLNSHTSFSFIGPAQNGLFAWRAKPHTGKTHQIRLHAKSAGIHVLGDLGSDNAPRLYLHSFEISFPWDGHFLCHQAKIPAEFGVKL
jgi:23S rRNA-/tRNA-specific pseudouridylate synthase